MANKPFSEQLLKKLDNLKADDHIFDGMLIKRKRGHDYYVLETMRHPTKPQLSVFWILNSLDEEEAQYVVFPIQLIDYHIQSILNEGWENMTEKKARDIVKTYMEMFNVTKYAPYYNGWQHPFMVARHILNQIDSEQFPLKG